MFLLSSKAGGVGLNLVCASRLIMFDINWNPATDRQAMARVWRDGQKRTGMIYRLISTDTIEEQIYQRQLLKNDLSLTVVDNLDISKSFSADELKLLFSFSHSETCHTYKLMHANGSAHTSRHLHPPFRSIGKIDPVLVACCSHISFMFHNQ